MPNFNRQWFPESEQCGLLASAISFEQCLRTKDFDSAARIALSSSRKNTSYWKRQYQRLNALIELHSSLSGSSINVFFADFWPGFNSSSNQILALLRNALPECNIVATDNRLAAHLEIFSCFPSAESKVLANQCSTKLLFLGENVRPSYTYYDLSLSFDTSNYCGRNITAGLWFFSLNILGSDYPGVVELVDARSLCSSRVFDYSSRQDAVVYIGNNCEPLRVSFINRLRQAGIRVDCYGSQTNPVNDKLALLSTYKVCLCPENSFYPGYVTEKIIHCAASGCMPLYWGGIDATPFSPYWRSISLSSTGIIDVALSHCSMAFSASNWERPQLIDSQVLEVYYGAMLSSLRDSLSFFIV